MRKRIAALMLAALFVVCLLAACGSTEAPPAVEPESSVSQPEESSEPEPSEPEPELPDEEAESEPVDDVEMWTPPFEGTGDGEVFNAVPMVPDEPPVRLEANLITFRIVDQNGNPVPYVAGDLEMSNDMYTAYSGLGAKIQKAPDRSGSIFSSNIPDENFYSDAGGNLYWEANADSPDAFLGSACKLSLYAYYNSEIRQELTVNMPSAVPATFDIVWTQATPPSEKPPQTKGVRFLIVDESGKPLPGVLLNGTDYPKEHTGPKPSIGGPFILGDENGVIRWENDFEAGTYEIGFSMEATDGPYMPYTLKHPGGSDLLEITVTFKP